MEREVATNLAEKQRLRQSIDQQTRSFLQRGGHITVVPTPALNATRPRGSIWQDRDATSEVLD